MSNDINGGDDSGKRLKISDWFSSPWLMVLPFFIGFVIWILLSDDRHFETEDRIDDTFIVLTDTMKTGASWLPDETVVLAPGTRLRMLGHARGLLVEDENGKRFRITNSFRDYSFVGDSAADRRSFYVGYKMYVKAKDKKSVFVGRNINEIVKEYGDYTSCDPSRGFYGFRYITPIIDGEKHENGLGLFVDGNGKVTESMMLEPEYATKNYVRAFPFYSTIMSWNLGRKFNSLYEDAKDGPKEEKESRGFFATVFGWIFGLIWGILWWLIKLVLLVLLVAVFFMVPALAVVGITQPLIHVKSISSTAITILNMVLIVPVVYIILVVFLDFFSSVWLVSLPLCLAFAYMAVMLPTTMTVVRRCPKCKSVDSIDTVRTKLDERSHYEYENHVHKGDKLRYKGYSLGRMRDEWERKVTHTTVTYLVTETDYRYDWKCRNCGDSGSYERTEKKREKKDVQTVETKETWVEK